MTSQSVLDSQVDARSNEYDDCLESIANEYAELLSKGLSVAPEVFAARFPNQDLRLLELLKSIRWMQLAARDLDDHSSKQPVNQLAQPGFLIDGNDHASLGDFRLIREVGRGGMGIVYEAEQISLSRRVAVKILPPSGLLHERHVARFAMESRAAAQLQHPNIVPVFAVGCEAGVYFYSMQLIDGCAPTGAMPPRDVAILGACVADALEHSHELGIIHRDIKPSNLLMDATGKVWVTDFGLARYRQSDQATASGAVLGTQRYMSPEQASGSELVDHRTDIYSLGVTLYELLTGRCPFDASNRSAFLTELARGEPVGIRQIDPSIPVDLETIVHKAISTEPQLRYPTARAMAEDLTRFINGDVILARRPTFLDRLSKWVSRNRQWVTAAASIWSITSIAAIFATVMLFSAQRETRRALEQTQKSLEESDIFFSQAREVVDHFGIALSRKLAVLPGTETARREVLQDTLRYYRNFMAQAERNPLRQREVAVTYMKLGRVAEQMEAFDEAVEAYQRSGLMWQSIAPNDADRALCANLLGLLLTKMAKPELADDAFNIAVECNQRIVASEPGNWEARRRYAVSLTNRSVSLPMHADPKLEMQWLQTALSLQQEMMANERIDSQMKFELILDMGKTNGALAAAIRSSDPTKAREYSQKCIECFEAAARKSREASIGSAADNELAHQQASDDLVLALCNHAAILNDAGEVTLAIATISNAIELGSRMCHERPEPHRSVNLVAAYNMLARLHTSQNKPLAQLESFQRASNILSNLVRDHGNVADYRVDLAAVSYNLHKTAESLSARAVATAARAELHAQHEWLREHAPARVSQVTELVNNIQSQWGTL